MFFFNFFQKWILKVVCWQIAIFFLKFGFLVEAAPLVLLWDTSAINHRTLRALPETCSPRKLTRPSLLQTALLFSCCQWAGSLHKHCFRSVMNRLDRFLNNDDISTEHHDFLAWHGESTHIWGSSFIKSSFVSFYKQRQWALCLRPGVRHLKSLTSPHEEW